MVFSSKRLTIIISAIFIFINLGCVDTPNEPTSNADNNVLSKRTPPESTGSWQIDWANQGSG